MSYKKKISIILLILVILISLIHVNKFFNALGEFIYYFSVVFSAILLAMLFLKEEIFNAWKKFAIIYLFVSMLIISFSSDRGGFIPFSYRDFFSCYLPISLFTTSMLMIIKYTCKWSLFAIISLGHLLSVMIWYVVAVAM
jgi:hypothetical protein